MKNIKLWLIRLFGCFLISLSFSILICGGCEFVANIWFNSNTSISLFIKLFIIIGITLIACLLLYTVNEALWKSVYKAKENKDNILLQMLPNIELIVEFIEFVGNPFSLYKNT